MELHADHERGMADVDAAQAHAAASGLSVDAENVLYVRKAILDEHKILLMVIANEGKDASATAKPYGGDPVSRDASVAFPQRASMLLEQCEGYVGTLLEIAQNLGNAALAYGYTEDDLAGSPINARAAVGELSATINSILNPWERG